MADVTTQYVWDYVVSISGNKYGTAALLGNLKAESGIIPYRLQGDFTSGYTKSITYTENVDNGTYTKNQFVNDSKGYGLAQWTFWDRKRKYYEWCQNRGGSIGSVENGVTYLVNELQTNYPSVWNVIVNATDIRSASDKVLHDFENPAEQGVNVEIYRASLGTAIYNEYSGGVVPPTPPTPPVPPIPPPPSDYSHILPIIMGG